MTSNELKQYRNSVDARIEMWDAQIRLLEAHVQGVDVPYTEKMVRTLRRKWHALACTLGALSAAEDDVWEDIFCFIEHAFKDLQRSLDEVRCHAQEQASMER